MRRRPFFSKAAGCKNFPKILSYSSSKFWNLGRAIFKEHLSIAVSVTFFMAIFPHIEVIIDWFTLQVNWMVSVWREHCHENVQMILHTKRFNQMKDRIIPSD